MNYPLEKECRKCHNTKPLEEFYPSKIGKYGRLSLCKMCERERVNTWIAKKGKKEKHRRKMYTLAFKYGLTETEYYDKLIEQNHKCLICGVDEAESTHRTLAVDHCHATGKIRGLLCGMCNKGLGHFKDNKELLLKAVAYLEEY